MMKRDEVKEGNGRVKEEIKEGMETWNNGQGNEIMEEKLSACLHLRKSHVAQTRRQALDLHRIHLSLVLTNRRVHNAFQLSYPTSMLVRGGAWRDEKDEAGTE
ncbi:hypothetical protein E2C01_058507 [Portunus trituberculatus]|uniref:Uncharacterized protein n=1 Tax=Portunus trituberculatus TaxID=210409 RepID=A0A5B7H002_PORTR|nr:hypothetical protein [Portunus trituberculatus]